MRVATFNLLMHNFSIFKPFFGQGSLKPVKHTSRVAVVTQTYRLVMELFVALFVLSLCPFDISAGVGAFVKELSRISSFFLSVPAMRIRSILKNGVYI